MNVSSRLCGAFAALALIGCGGATDDGSQGPSVAHQAIVGGQPAAEYPEAGYLNIDRTTDGMTVCSAVLIAPKVVMTAGHCVDGFKKWEVQIGSAYRVAIGASTFDYEGNGGNVNPKQHDIGLVFLGEEIVIPRYPKLARAPLPSGSQVVSVGRVQDGIVKNSLYMGNVEVSSGEAIGYDYDYMSDDVIQPGDSGGPAFELDTHTIVGINSGAGGNVQVLARVDLLVTWIAEQIASTGGLSVARGQSNDTAAAAATDVDGTRDQLPIASEVTLPGTVRLPDKIYFSGAANDDLGLSSVTMLVQGPTGNQVVAFLKPVSGSTVPLTDLAFDSGNSTYANVPGNYLVTLSIQDSRSQVTTKRFALEVAAAETCRAGFNRVDGNCVAQECVARQVQPRICAVPNGRGFQVRTCASNGIWGGWAPCSVTDCNAGYRSSAASCVKP